MTVAEYYHGLGVVHRTDGNCPVCDTNQIKINQKGAAMLKLTKKSFWTLVAIFAVLAAWVIMFRPDYVVGGWPPKTHHDMFVVSDKYDGDCTGHETVGRCADKCPDGNYLQGFDKETGAAVCNQNPTGCPYGDHVPIGPECDKLAPVQPIQQTQYMEVQGK